MNQATPKEHRLTLPETVDALVADGLVAAEEAARFKQERRYYKGEVHPLIAIAGQRWKSLQAPNRVLDLDLLTQWLAKWSGLEYLHIDPLKIDFSAVTEVMSNTYATRYRILPVEVKAHEVVIATAEPFQRGWEAEMQPILRKDIRRVISNPDDITRYQVEFYNLAKSIKGALGRGDVTGGASNFEQLVELGKGNKQFDANDQHIVTIVDWLWQYAFEQRASDIHVEPRRDLGIVRFRIDGVLHQVYQIPPNIMNAITSRIKLLGRMDMVEKRRPQDGRIKTLSAEGNEIELRLSTMPTAFGEKLVMRIFSPDISNKDFIALGFSETQAEKWDSWAKSPNGIILVTGPTGSGKTTTLYSTLRMLATSEVNVCTVEDPIEMVEPAFNQMQVQQNIGLGFAEGIRTLMRQDPDIVMVGEIRDIETAEMTIQAALTGHLVLSTLHTNDAPSAVTRLLDLGVPSYLIHSTVLGIMAQRLVRTLCPSCKAPEPITQSDWSTLVGTFNIPKPDRIYRPVGCLECRNTGFKGRSGIYEMLSMSRSLRKLITPDTNLAKLTKQAYQEGMQPLIINGAEKVAAGLTTIEELLKVAPPLETE